MLTVGIKELKAKLSSYVESASAAEEVVVTDHGREVALLVPIFREREAVRVLMDSGKVQWSGGKPKGTSGTRIKGKPLAEIVVEERRKILEEQARGLLKHYDEVVFLLLKDFHGKRERILLEMELQQMS